MRNPISIPPTVCLEGEPPSNPLKLAATSFSNAGQAAGPTPQDALAGAFQEFLVKMSTGAAVRWPVHVASVFALFADGTCL